MSRYKYYQPNEKDKKDKCGDCVVRALTKATDRGWRDVFSYLVNIAMNKQVMPNDKECYEEYLISHGFKYNGVSNKKGSKRPTVDSFAKDNKQGTYVLRVAGHLVTVDDGFYYDTWDCGSKSVYGYWKGGVR